MLKSKKIISLIMLCVLTALCCCICSINFLSTKQVFADGTHTHGTEWTSDNTLPTDAGSYYLTKNVTVSDTWEITNSITLCLNGYNIVRDGGDCISVSDGGTLTICDCGNTVQKFKDDDGLWKFDGTGDKSVIGGVIMGKGDGQSSSIGIQILSGGTFYLNGGNIVGNYSTGSGAGVNNSGTFIMNGGLICGNKAKTNGGGVYSAFNSVCILTGGTITDNTAGFGGGVYYKSEECFAKGTPITMADGSRLPIEELKIGDLVRVFDHDTGEISTAKLFDYGKYPEQHSNVVALHFTNGIDLNIVYGHSFFDREANKYVSVSKDNVSEFIGHEFYNVDDARFETLIGYDFVDGAVDTYVITTEKHQNCVANGMLSNEDGFYTLITNIFEYGDDLKIDQEKKQADINKYGLFDFKNIKHASKETYDMLNIQYLNVAFGKGMITREAFFQLESYWTATCPEYCESEQEQDKNNITLFGTAVKLFSSSVPAPETAGIYVGGSIRIYGNNEDNLYVESAKAITIGTGTTAGGNGVIAPTENMYIGITMQDLIGQFSVNGAENWVGYFFSDNDNYSVCFNDAGTSDTTDDYLDVKKNVAFDEEYKWNNGSEILYGTDYSLIAPKVYDGEEITEITFSYTFYQTEDAGITWLKLDGKPTSVGDFKVVIAVVDDAYCGEKEFSFTISCYHTLISVDGKKATFKEDGFKQAWKCSVCGNYFKDENGTQLIGDETAYNQWKQNDGYITKLEKSGLNSTAIKFIVFGAVLLLLIVIYLLGYFLLYRKGKLDEKDIKVIYQFLPKGKKEE